MPKLSATVITLNEASNIERCLKSLAFCDEVIVVDSGSADGTQEIAQKLGAKVIQNPWKGYGQQKNYAHNLCRGEWILNVDADEEVSEPLKNEILTTLQKNPKENGFFIPRLTSFCGKWIHHGGWYPGYLMRLSRKNLSQWTEPEVHELLMVEGEVAWLKSNLLHYSFPTLQDQIKTNLRYSALGANSLILKNKSSLGLIFGMLFKPISKFLESYLFKAGFLDGWRGFIISANASHSIFMKYSDAFLKRRMKELR